MKLPRQQIIFIEIKIEVLSEDYGTWGKLKWIIHRIEYDKKSTGNTKSDDDELQCDGGGGGNSCWSLNAGVSVRFTYESGAGTTYLPTQTIVFVVSKYFCYSE